MLIKFSIKFQSLYLYRYCEII